MTEAKEKYERPELAVIGSFEEVTQATHSGTNADVALGRHETIIGHLS